MTDDPKVRRLLPPGTYRITANIVIEGDLTEEQLRSIFQVAPAAVLTAERKPPLPPVDPETARRKADLEARVVRIVEAYRAKLGEPPLALAAALVDWLGEFSEEELRMAIEETAVAPQASTRDERYECFRDVLRGWRRKKRFR